MELGARIGEGQTAEVFAFGPDKVLKLYRDWVPVDWVSHQLRVDELVQRAGVPCPKTFGSTEIDGRFGILYERVRGTTMRQLIESSPWKIVHYGRKMAALHHVLHETTTSAAPSQKEHLREAMLQSSARLDEASLASILAKLDALPFGQTVCHGDFHPDNILVTETGDAVIIDWANVSIGHPLADVARTLLMLSSPFLPLNIPLPTRVALRTLRPMLRRAYIREYCRRSGTSLAEIMAWTPVVAAARLREQLPGEAEWLLKLIRRNPATGHA